MGQLRTDIRNIQDPEIISAAAEARFQRAVIAVLCMIEVIFNTPIPAYFIVLTSLLAGLISFKLELISLFYREIVRRLLRRDLFSFSHIFPGSFLLDDETNRFIYFVYAVFHGVGIALYYSGTIWWVAPIAVIAAGTTLAATTGICGMGFLYALTREWRNSQHAAG